MNLDNLKKGANEIFVRLINSMRDEKGLCHPQSLLCALGSLAGYACQRDVRDVYMKGKGFSEDKVFTVVQDKKGRNYFFGDLINEPVAEGKYSLWSLVGGALNAMNVPLIDLNDIFRYVSYVCGGEQFGKVRSCVTGETMESYLKILWKPLFPLAQKYAEENELHIVFGLAVQKAMMACKGAVEPQEMARIVMESAVSMSKIELV